MSKFMVIFHAAFSIVLLLAFLGNIYYCRKGSATKKEFPVFYTNIMNTTKENDNFRNVLATALHGQVVLMSIMPGETVGKESHDVDQVFVFTQGDGKAIINDKEYIIAPGDLFLVPAESVHDFINTGKETMKLFTVYAPPEHKQGLIQKLKPIKD